MLQLCHDPVPGGCGGPSRKGGGPGRSQDPSVVPDSAHTAAPEGWKGRGNMPADGRTRKGTQRNFLSPEFEKLGPLGVPVP